MDRSGTRLGKLIIPNDHMSHGELVSLDWDSYRGMLARAPGHHRERGQGMTEEELYARASRVPLGRIAQPVDIAGAIAFLCSVAAECITGQLIAVNGGTDMA